ncbi:hypothetical protein AAHE18_16G106500 [Arachis hypogaea]
MSTRDKLDEAKLSPVKPNSQIEKPNPETSLSASHNSLQHTYPLQRRREKEKERDPREQRRRGRAAASPPPPSHASPLRGVAPCCRSAIELPQALSPRRERVTRLKRGGGRRPVRRRSQCYPVAIVRRSSRCQVTVDEASAATVNREQTRRGRKMEGEEGGAVRVAVPSCRPRSRRRRLSLGNYRRASGRWNHGQERRGLPLLLLLFRSFIA